MVEIEEARDGEGGRRKATSSLLVQRVLQLKRAER